MVFAGPPVSRDGAQAGHLRIEVGQGLDAIVTDLQASRVRDLVTPVLRSGDYAQGLDIGVRALASIIVQGMGIRDSSLTQPNLAIQRNAALRIPPWVIAIVVIIIWIILANVRRRGGGLLGGIGP